MTGRFKFCLWLLEKLMQRRMTFNEIAREWSQASANENASTLTPRSFLRYRNIAEELFNVNIECYKPTNEYWIDPSSIEEVDRWTLSALRLQNLTSIADLHKVIMLEPPPAGSEYVKQIAEACNDRRKLHLTYKSPYQPERTFILIPYFLRLFKQRWYLTGRQPDKDYTTTVALERIKDFKILDDVLEESAVITPEQYYEGCYGIIRQGETEKIVIRAFNPQDSYLKEVPIHPSQKVVDETDDWTDFSLYVRPTYDFKQELLSQRDKLTVIAPQWLREDMIDILERMIRSYKSGLPNYKDE